MRNVFIDCTDTCATGKNTGIQRVVRSFVHHASTIGSEFGLRCIPVVIRRGAIVEVTDLDDPSLRHPRMTLRGTLNTAYLRMSHRLAQALPWPPLQRFLSADRREFGLAWLIFSPFRLIAWMRTQCSSHTAPDSKRTIHPVPGDVLLLADASWGSDVLSIAKRMKDQGVRIVVFLQDIIPLTHPNVCHHVHAERFQHWFWQVVDTADLVVCNSQSTQDSFKAYLRQSRCSMNPASSVVYLGHDLGPVPQGDIQHAALKRALFPVSDFFLCVGTLEPRKNLELLLDAFDLLWDEALEAPLILIGRSGWMCEQVESRIRHHPLRNKQLFWFDDVNDRDLVLVYQKGSALIFPSIAEGFGLPLVEALGQGLQVIASDIPVFREIAQTHARFFPPHDAQALATAVRTHLSRPAAPLASTPFSWPSWEASTRQLLHLLQDSPSQ